MTRSQPPSGEFTTAVCGVNYIYQLLAVMLLKQLNGLLLYIFSRPQVATDNGVRDYRSN